MERHKIGIMQGRLTPPAGRGIQFFPFDNWEQEFHQAGENGLDEIEFIFDYERYEENPLWTREGVKALGLLMKETGVRVRSVCFDYFMRRAFYKQLEEEEGARRENVETARRVLEAMGELQIGLLEIPLVDDSSLKYEEEKEKCREFLEEISRFQTGKMQIGLETDLPPEEFAAYLRLLEPFGIGANYDSGNSSGLGYDPYEEVNALKDKIFNIHIKDRKYRGTTMELGTGDADFERLFRALGEIRYKGSFILQAARGAEGMEAETVRKQMEFVRGYEANYL